MKNRFHLFFDLDRTLWDFDKNSQVALKILHKELDLQSKGINFYDFFHKYKRINAELWVEYGKGKITKEELRTTRFEKCLIKFGVVDDELNQKLNDGYIEISPNQTHVFPHSHETIKELKNDEYNLHIITNGFKEVQYRKLDNCGFSTYFDVILCSEEVGKNKPAPDVFHAAMEKAGADPKNSVMIGDDLHVDYLGALNAGMKAILFDPEKNHRTRKDDHHIQSLKQIPEILPWVFREVF